MAEETPFWDPSYEDENTATLKTVGADGAIYASNVWDTCTIGGQKLPGMVEINATAKRKVDKKKQNGSDGSTPTFHGYDPATVGIVVHIWTAEQLQDLVDQMKTLWQAAGKSAQNISAQEKHHPAPFDIYHPKLAMLNITQIIITEVDALKPGKAQGSMSLGFKCLEFRPPVAGKKRNASSTPTRSVENRIAPKEVKKANKPGEQTLQSKQAPSNQNQSTPGNDKNFTGPNGP